MSFASQFPNQYRNAVLTGTSTGEGVKLLFNATYVRLVNAGQVPVYFRLDSTEIATTADHPLQPGEIWNQQVPWLAGFGLGTASTSTGTAEKRVEALALGA